jgi:hypothetical protein
MTSNSASKRRRGHGARERDAGRLAHFAEVIADALEGLGLELDHGPRKVPVHGLGVNDPRGLSAARVRRPASALPRTSEADTAAWPWQISPEATDEHIPEAHER